MEYAGLKIAVNLYITLVFSRQMANRNAGPLLDAVVYNGRSKGALDGGSPIPMSNLKNGPVACHCR